ncbi:MAG: hypothetical protein PHX22_12090 [Dysgonamonadaceae bacterium]|nr:hypothetical protein [Dysgonamonadaceae bacterium]
MGMFDTLYAAASNPGHSWSEMDCDDTLCITEDKNIGVGTMTPSQKLEINGNIKLGGEEPTYTISNIKDPTNASDLATKNYIDREIAKVGVMVSGTLPLVHSDHTQKDCVDSGGVPVDSSTELKQCKFVASTCPTGWTANENWTTTESSLVYHQSKCTDYHDDECFAWAPLDYYTCSTPEHSFSNKEPEWARSDADTNLVTPCYGFTHGKCYDSEIGYVGTFGWIPKQPYYCSRSVTGYAKIVEIGCY